MSPYDLARMVYSTEPCARSFDEDLRLHLAYGYVFATPVAFIMGRPVELKANYEFILDPSHVFAEPDTWLVYLAAGDWRYLWRYLPYPLPFIAWQRNNDFRVYPMARLLKAAEAGAGYGTLHSDILSALLPATVRPPRQRQNTQGSSPACPALAHHGGG